MTHETTSIEKRYSALAEGSCCLSCGGALEYARAQKGEVCVDLGSGRGTDSLRLAESVGSAGTVYGVDISDGMLEKARKNAEKLGIRNVTFVKSNLEKLDIPSSSVDLVISNCTINHASNKQNVWDEIFRILKKGGRFVVSDIYSEAPVAEEYRLDPEAVAECWAGAITRDEYMRILEQAGFDTVEVIEESQPYDKGKIRVRSFTIAARKRCCC
jgi:ubiquinone/menaquinone biosynthesis C-methylase UbiE